MPPPSGTPLLLVGLVVALLSSGWAAPVDVRSPAWPSLLPTGSVGARDGVAGSFDRVSCELAEGPTHPCALPASSAVAWENITASAGPGPSPRVGAAMTYDAQDGYVLLFGGENGGGTQFYSDTWKFSGGSWTNLTGSAGTPPFGRGYALMVDDPGDGKVVLFGGLSEKGGTYPDDLSDTWTFSGGRWTNVTGSAGASPPGRFSMSGAYDDPDHEVVAFGGENFSISGLSGSIKMYADTWTFHGGKWAQITGTAGTPPSARAGANVVFDPSSSEVLLYGGEWETLSGTTVSGYEMADTWTFSGGAWSNRTASVSGTPGDLALSATAWDPNAAEVVMFGGCLPPVSESCGGLTNATWAFQNNTWTNRSGSLSVAPSDRALAAMTNDSSDGELLLFGGSCGSGCGLGDTWTENGKAASLPVVTFSTSPSSCGPILFDGTSEASGASEPFPRGHDPASAGPCAGYEFNGWNVSGALTVAPVHALSTSVAVSGPGTLTAWFSVPLQLQASANTSAVGLGGSALLTAAAWGGVGPYAYAWELNGSANVSAADPWSITFPHAGNYSYVAWATDAVGTIARSSALVVEVLPRVLPPLSVNVTLDAYYAAAGSTIIASASTSGGTATTFVWSENGSLALPCTTASCATMLPHGGRYTFDVLITDLYARTASGGSAVSIVYQASTGPPPALSLTLSTNLTTVYVGEPFALNWTTSGGVPPYHFVLWTNVSGNVSAGFQGWSATWDFPHGGIYDVRVWATDFDAELTGGNVVSIAVQPTPQGSSSPPSGSSGVPGGNVDGIPLLVLVLAPVVVAAVLLALLLRRHRRRPPSPPAPTTMPADPYPSAPSTAWGAGPNPPTSGPRARYPVYRAPPSG